MGISLQRGEIPSMGLGTATLHDQVCVDAVRTAIRAGIRHIDTALLYNNQEAVGTAIKEAIAAGDCSREDLWVTSKVAFYPGEADGASHWVPGKFHPENRKGKAITAAAIDLCLKKLQLDYVDLMLIHSPCTTIDEYEASCCAHFFELKKNPFYQSERKLIMESRLDRVQHDAKQAAASRSETWSALEEARVAGKCRFIGVSNYSVPLLAEMETYAKVMPAANQLELHPRYASPSLRKYAKEKGIHLTAYGTGNSVLIEKDTNATVKEIAAKHGINPLAVVIRWTLHHGVSVIPRSGDAEHIRENCREIALAQQKGTKELLPPEDVARLDALHEEHPYYWSPWPLLAPEDRGKAL